MPEKVLMIALSPTMETGTLARWRKKEGDTVASGDVLCEVETDKATMDYESSSEGTLLKILLPEGGQAKVGDLIAIIGKPGEDISALVAEKPAPAAPASPAVKAPSGQPARKTAPQPPAAAAPPAAHPARPAGRVRSSPLARKLAAQRGIDLAALRGSGPEGRIVKRDLEAAPAGAAPAAGRAGFTPSAPELLKPGPGDQSVPVSRMRKIIAKRLSESMYTSPHFYLTVAVGMDELLGARAHMNAGREKKISVNAFLMALAGRTLARHPQVNTSWNGDTFLRHASADIGLAVALPEGLITPVVRDCGRKGIAAIDAELVDLIARARLGKLAPEEYSGATFSISNLGTSGIDEFTAIINPPGSAILAVGAVRKEAVVREDDSIVVRQRMRITLSCDHRVIDGAVGAAFLRELADMLENPLLALA
jgi:pyruvate dehydrogenase E2 component (dihydrolipoamide acetyltransferase)